MELYIMCVVILNATVEIKKKKAEQSIWEIRCHATPAHCSPSQQTLVNLCLRRGSICVP